MTLPKSIFQQKVLTLVAALAVFFFSATARLAVAWPGLLDNAAARFARPDTAGYVSEATELATSGRISGTGRVPGFPVVVALFVGKDGKIRPIPLVVFLSFVGAATSVAVLSEDDRAARTRKPSAKTTASIAANTSMYSIAACPLSRWLSMCRFYHTRSARATPCRERRRMLQ